jgi:hypothetical protein
MMLREERAGGYYVEHQMQAFLRGDMNSRSSFYERMFGLAVYTPNDIAAKENMNPIGPLGDERFLTVQAQPLSSLVAKPPEAGAPPDAAAGVASPADAAVADTALNGAQITSLLGIVGMVTTGQLPKEAAKGMILASFSSLTDEQVAAILDPLDGFEPPPPPDTKPSRVPVPSVNGARFAKALQAVGSPRENPHHGADGKFASGGKGKGLKAPSELSDSEFKDLAAKVETVHELPAISVGGQTAKITVDTNPFHGVLLDEKKYHVKAKLNGETDHIEGHNNLDRAKKKADSLHKHYTKALEADAKGSS